MTKYYLGVDVGNTKSHALIADEQGQAIGFSETGPGSWEAIGWQGAREVLGDLIHRTLTSAGLDMGVLTGAGFGLAGYDWPEDVEPHRRMIDSLDLGAPYAMVNDAMSGLLAGSRTGWGVAVSAGTSVNCRGRDQQGRVGRVTGSSALFGEHAGALELVGKAVQAVAAAWTQRGPSTVLGGAFLEATGARDTVDLLAGLARDRYYLGPAHAPIVFDVAASGDQVAQDLITWSGRGLGDLANGVIRQLNFENSAFEVVLAGSFYKGSPRLIDVMRETIHAVAPLARLVRLRVPPVVGATLLGMEQGGLDAQTVRRRLIDSTGVLLDRDRQSNKKDVSQT
ncbi:MAG: BadF/BadG/BcrA/BcrD ATPase family protein [Chloroflexota bacterium]|nr:BadF/BadG/BcrA/BcrD ATPase family protein [Chloroflexota bacterium]